MDELLQEFLSETGEHLDTVDRELVRFEQEPNNTDILRNIFRLVHTVKGTCGFIGLPRLEALTHAAESVMGQFRDGASVSSSAVTAILETIDQIKEIMAELTEKGQEPPGNDDQLIGELRALAARAKQELASREEPAALDPVAAYLARSAGENRSPGEAKADDLDLVFRAAPSPLDQPRPQSAEETAARPVGPATLRVNVDTLEHLMTMVSELVLTRNQLLEISRQQEDSGIKAPLQRLSLITAELQDGVMKTRMQPIGNAWSKLPRIVRDLSTDLDKKIELVMEGEDTELDRQILELIKDPLTHMVRNCADHAIEPPAERLASGKPETGTIRVSAYHEGGSVTIAISDDGRGMDVARIRAKAIEQRLASEAEIEKMSEAQILRFVFHPGFSTSEEVSAISGRGVGMDVVKVNVDAIGGVVDIVSVAGSGTAITIKIPLTLAIVSALIVACGNQRFAIPQVVVRELVRVKAGSEHRIERINDSPVLRLRDRLLPIIALSGMMGHDSKLLEDGFIVVTQVGERQFGILVDSVFHTEEIVVKPMSTKLRHIPLFSGNTILGDGAVVLIIDPNGVARLVGAFAAGHEDSVPAMKGEVVSASERTTMLVFRAGTGQLKAVPLALVTRLEEVDAALFESGGGRFLLNYRGRLMPIVPVEGVTLRQSGLQPLVIFSDGDFAMALAVEAIVDIVEEALDIEMVAMAERGVVGSAIIRGRATEIVDLAHYLPLANASWMHSRRDEGAAGPHVLLVEPSDFLREMLVPVLKASGMRVSQSADIALAAGLAAGKADLAAIVLDLDRDPEAALALASQLRAEPRHAGLRIIGLSTLPTPELHLAAAQVRINEVVTKFDRRALIAELAECRAGQRRAA